MPNCLDILIPAKNEAKSLPELLERIDKHLKKNSISYHVYIIDDHSSDNTAEVIQRLSKKYPLNYKLKVGSPGKAYSILEAAKMAHSPYLAMIDADLEYPPEALAQMFTKLNESGCGIVVANRESNHKDLFRRIVSRTNRFILGRCLLGLSCDVQSGLKAFRREVIEHLDPSKLSAWSLDMPLLATANQLGYHLSTVSITFTSRKFGVSKCKNEVLTATKQIITSALHARSISKSVLVTHPTVDSDLNAGLIHRGHKFTTHTSLPLTHSAYQTLQGRQKYWLVLLIAFLVVSITYSFTNTLIGFIALLSFTYFVDLVFSALIVFRSLRLQPDNHFSPNQLSSIKAKDYPTYTILCPLYKEWQVLPHFVDSIKAINWPKNKLEVLLLLEENDQQTIEVAHKEKLPSYFRIVIVPDSLPKTKPKACNYGLVKSTGEYTVIYDAEDRPDPDQLKKAYLAFKKLPQKVACLQAKLNYYNATQNLLTRLFTAEYSLWFDVILPGYQSINTVIPLGGTSNHFRTAILKKLRGWDPFNVTEDCDLGIRLFKAGYSTAIIDSTTYEEANPRLGNWLRQRSRWIKGYFQTWLVHNRNPLEFVRLYGIHAFIFQLIIGGKTIFTLINPILWLATIAYFSLHSVVGSTIESLYPSAVFYFAGFSALFGNFLFLFVYMIGLAKRGSWSLVKYVYVMPVYWLLVSISAFKAVYQLILRPHYWEKTQHGLHVNRRRSFVINVSIKLPEFPTLPTFPLIRDLMTKVSNRISSDAITPTPSLISAQPVAVLKKLQVVLPWRILLFFPWFGLQVTGIYYTYQSLSASLSVIAFTSSGYFVSVRMINLIIKHQWSINRFIADLSGVLNLFVPSAPPIPGSIRILVFNWRDIKHKWSGGAEVYIHELAKRWVKAGNQVTLFCGNDGQQPQSEVIDGVHVIRRGGFFTLYILAPIYYLLAFSRRYDIVVDSENGIPFFSPLFSKVPKVLLIHHIHQELFRSKLYFPMDQIAMILESKLMPKAYANHRLITVSKSSKEDILKLKFVQDSNIEIVSPGVELSKFVPSVKTSHPSFLYLGRIRRQKNLDVAIKAFSQIHLTHPEATLTIAGRGEDIPRLKRLAASLRLTPAIHFLEWVSEEQKVQLLAQSWAAIQPSSFEGWGITVIEANASQTPVIASNVPGLRDSVIDELTGLLVPPLNVNSLSQAMSRIITDTKLRQYLGENAMVWAQNFNWDNQANKFLSILHQHLEAQHKYNITTNPNYA